MNLLKIGELAERSGVTVRTLHHYDDIGLLTPSQRSDAGYRLYTERDARRLARIVALRGLGMSLEEIGHALDNGGSDLGDALSRLQQQVRAEIEDLERIQSALEQLIELENHAGRVTPDDVRALMEATKMINAYYTDEQLEKLDERYQQLSSEDLTRVQREWQEVFAALRHAMDDGCAPDHPRVARAARTANRLIEEFTGGDEGIRSSLESMYEGEGHQAVLDHRGYDVDEGLSGFLRRALDALPDE